MGRSCHSGEIVEGAHNAEEWRKSLTGKVKYLFPLASTEIKQFGKRAHAKMREEN